MSGSGRSEVSDLQRLMNVGVGISRYFERVGIVRVDELVGRDPVEVYEQMCVRDGVGHDRCLLDTIMSAVDQSEGKPGRRWWEYTEDRTRLLQGRR